MKSRRQTYKLGTSKVKKQIVSNYSLHIDNDGVVCSLLYFWSVCANTIASRGHGHFDLQKKKKKSIAERIQFTAYYSRNNFRCFQIIIRILYSFFLPSHFCVTCTRELLGYAQEVEMEFSFSCCLLKGNKSSFWHSHLKGWIVWIKNS